MYLYIDLSIFNLNVRLGAFDFNGTFFLRKILKILGFFDFFKKNESEAP